MGEALLEPESVINAFRWFCFGDIVAVNNDTTDLIMILLVVALVYCGRVQFPAYTCTCRTTPVHVMTCSLCVQSTQ